MQQISRIKGVFDTPHLQNIGNIKIGTKGEKRSSARGGDYRPPLRLGHFLVTTLEVKNGVYTPDEQALRDYGAEPKDLPILLPFPRVDQCLITSYSCFNNQRRFCYGDGEVAFRFNESTNGYSQLVCDPNTCPYYQKGVCKPYGMLKVYLRTGPEFSQIRGGGLFVFRTTSWTSLFSLHNSLYDIQRLVGSENLMGVPLWLRYTFHTIKGTEMRTVPNVIFEYRAPCEDVRARSSALVDSSLPDWVTESEVETPEDVIGDTDVEPQATVPDGKALVEMAEKSPDALSLFNELNNGATAKKDPFGELPGYVYQGTGKGNGSEKAPAEEVPEEKPKPRKRASSKRGLTNE